MYCNRSVRKNRSAEKRKQRLSKQLEYIISQFDKMNLLNLEKIKNLSNMFIMQLEEIILQQKQLLH